MVIIEMENGKKIELEMLPQYAPNTVKNFLSLVSKGFYDGLTFHRVVKGFVIQGGCPEGNGMGGPGHNIAGEFAGAGFYDNSLKHQRGVISMARSQDPNSAGSQFFIIHEDAPFLDGQYAAFGKVINGMDVVDEIAEVKTGFGDRPKEEQKMKSIILVDEKVEEPITFIL